MTKRRERNQNLLLNRHVMADTAPFALKSNAAGVIWSGRRGVEWRATLRIGVMVVVLHTSMISPRHSPYSSSSSSTKGSMHWQINLQSTAQSRDRSTRWSRLLALLGRCCELPLQGSPQDMEGPGAVPILRYR